MLSFTKMQGIGNDFVMLDRLACTVAAQDESSFPELDFPSLARELCDRRFGIGGDGLIVVDAGNTLPYRMTMFNPDGSESEMCGNGIRCLGRLLVEHHHTSETAVDVETGAGTLSLEFVAPDRIRVDMGPAKTLRGEIGMTGDPFLNFINQPVGEGLSGTAVSMGNPHLVIFVPDVSAVKLEELGPKFEQFPVFAHRTNVHFVQVVDSKTLIQRTWERGAGITLACGTGACACGVAGFLTGRSERAVNVRLPGGNLKIEYREDTHVLMTGPAEVVFEGEMG